MKLNGLIETHGRTCDGGRLAYQPVHGRQGVDILREEVYDRLDLLDARQAK